MFLSNFQPSETDPQGDPALAILRLDPGPCPLCGREGGKPIVRLKSHKYKWPDPMNERHNSWVRLPEFVSVETGLIHDVPSRCVSQVCWVESRGLKAEDAEILFKSLVDQGCQGLRW